MRLLLASNNKGKHREMSAILNQLGIDVITPKELGILLDVDENGTTYYENALLKAKAFAFESRLMTVADDSGLEVEALNNEPGIYSARYGGEGLNDKERTALLLKALEGKEDRRARFVSCIVCYNPENGKILTATGTVEGIITTEEHGTNGFGYDPVFYIGTYQKTMAEISDEEKNKISHRGKALQKFYELLKNEMNSEQ